MINFLDYVGNEIFVSGIKKFIDGPFAFFCRECHVLRGYNLRHIR